MREFFYILTITAFLLNSYIFASGELVWKYDIHHWKGSSSPCILYPDSIVCAYGSYTDWSDMLYCFDKKTGEIKWKKEFGGGDPSSSLASGNGVIYLCGRTNQLEAKLMAIRAKDGSIIWEYVDKDTRASFFVTPCYHEGVIYTRSYYHYAFNAENGQVIWKVYQYAPEGNYKACISGNLIFYGYLSDLFQALNKKNGDLVWRKREEEDYHDWQTSPVAWNEVVYFCHPFFNGTTSCGAANAKDGSTVWKADGQCAPSDICLSNGVLYYGSIDRYLYARNAIDGSLKWRFLLGDVIYGSACVAQDPVTREEQVFIGNDFGYMYAMDAAEGKRLWIFKTEGKIRSTPCIADSIVYFTCEDGYLYAVNIGFKDGFSNKQSSHHLPSSSLSTYPNPFTDRLTIETSDKARIYSITGQFIMKVDKGKHSLDTSSWREGIYIIKSASETKRILKIN